MLAGLFLCGASFPASDADDTLQDNAEVLMFLLCGPSVAMAGSFIAKSRFETFNKNQDMSSPFMVRTSARCCWGSTDASGSCILIIFRL